jgi:Cys-tRNA(Pro)/Cys-tRNA(Cys) deacylase
MLPWPGSGTDISRVVAAGYAFVAAIFRKSAYLLDTHFKMTPAINAARHAKAPFHVHEYVHDPKAESYGEEAAVKLNLPLARVFKTLVVSLDGRELAVAVVPVSGMLDMKVCAAALGAKKCDMADRKAAERSTGYVLGGISPLGQKKRLRTVIDVSAQGFETVFVSAGRRGLEIELAPAELARLTGGVFATLSRG